MSASLGIPAILAELEPLLGPAERRARPLDGGITNRNYRVRLGAEDYVDPPARQGHGAARDRPRRRSASANAAAADLGSRPRVVRRPDACLVTRFIACRPVARPELRRRARRGRRGRCGAFHELGPELPGAFWVPDLLEDYARIVLERGGALPDAYEHARAVAARIAGGAAAERERAPCHNDLLPANLIRARMTERVLLVDWEYAGMGDPFFDLGNLSVNNDFDDAQADLRLLSAYLGRPPERGERAGCS